MPSLPENGITRFGGRRDFCRSDSTTPLHGPCPAFTICRRSSTLSDKKRCESWCAVSNLSRSARASSSEAFNAWFSASSSRSRLKLASMAFSSAVTTSASVLAPRPIPHPFGDLRTLVEFFPDGLV